jgi:hypothetical protein
LTDISNLFKQDDAVFDLEIKGRDPETGEEVGTGIVWKIRSVRNPDAIAIAERKQKELLGRKWVAGKEVTDEDGGEVVAMISGIIPSDEQLATCVVDWDWGDKKLGDLDTKFSRANVLKVITSVAEMKRQLVAGVAKITDFTKA